MNKLLQMFNRLQGRDFTAKERIVQRLLEKGHINSAEATLLLRSVEIKIDAETLNMSSGAKIVGGSDFETNQY